VTEINCVGELCPIPVIRAKKALDAMASGELIITVDNNIASQNLEKLAKEKGCTYNVQKSADGKLFRVSLQKDGKNTEENIADMDKHTVHVMSGNTIVAITSDMMGEGEAKLGQTLIKGFIYALSECDTPPGAIVFYNKGALLTNVGSESIEDLKKLQERGTEVLTCGACVDFYGLSLSVGEVTNMYSIVEKFMAADKIIKP